MRNPRRVLIVAGIAALAVVVVLVAALFFYAGSGDAKSSLLVKYFRSVSSGDPESVSDLTSPSFASDLEITSLERGMYELYDFGEQNPDSVRFLILLTGTDGKKRAILADMTYARRGMTNLVESIVTVDEGIDLKE